jgi:hypothetical protein
MLGIYYRIWVDCIKRGKSQPPNKYNWPIASMIFMSSAMVLNFALVMVILERNVLGHSFYSIRFPLLSQYLNNAVSFFILFVLPVIIINYLLIFRKKRYKKLLKRYPYYNGKLFITYFLVSILTPIVLLWIGIIFFRQ